MEAAGPARLAALAGMLLTCLALAMKGQHGVPKCADVPRRLDWFITCLLALAGLTENAAMLQGSQLPCLPPCHFKRGQSVVCDDAICARHCAKCTV